MLDSSESDSSFVSVTHEKMDQHIHLDHGKKKEEMAITMQLDIDPIVPDMDDVI